MTSNWQKSNEATYSTDDLSSSIEQLSNNLTTIDLYETQQNFDDLELRKQNLVEECASWKKRCDELIMQKQAIEIRSDILLADNQRIIEEKDNELQRLRETINANNSSTNQPDTNEFVKYQQMINELKDENSHLKNEVINLKKTLEVQEQTEKDYDEQVQTLQLRIKELEDWNGDTIEIQNKDHSNLQSNIDLLISRNRQLENDLQRFQLQQRNNQLAIERLDEYEETISQLQEELDQLRSNKKKQQINNDEDKNCLLIEERKRSEIISHLLEETRLQLKNEIKQSEEKILQIETNLTKQFEREKTILLDQLQKKEIQIEIERNERENFQQLKNDQIEIEKEINIRDMLERQIIELNEEVQSLENDKYELQQQLQSKDRQIQTFQTSAVTPGSPPTIISLSDTRNLSPYPQKSELETQINQNEQQLNSIYNQFVTLLPGEFSSSDNTHLSLSDRFVDLYEQFSTYIGTFSIIQEELDSLKQILNEKQDELEKFRTHLELTTDKLTQLQEEQSLSNKNKSFESDEDELEEILRFQQRAPSRQSLLSVTPGEKQQLIAQNELLSTLLTEKEQELILLQQAEKTHEDLMKHLEILRLNLQQMEFDKEVKQIELNDIRNILDEKLRENSSLKKEKMYFIEKLAEFERERQEQQSIIQISPKQSSPDREKSPASIKIKTIEQNTEQIVTQEQYEKLRSDYDQLLELSTRQHDESLSYYNEYTRILTLYNDLNTKHTQLQIDYESLQSLIQQKNEAYLQCQNELNTYQNLLYHQKKKSEDIDLLHSILNEREIKLQELITNEKQLLIKQSELELNVKFLEENNSKLISTQELFEQIQLDLKHITHERDLAIVEKKQLENKMEINQEKLLQSEEHEQKLLNEIERLIRLEKSLRNQFNIDIEQSQQALIIQLETLKYEYEKTEQLNTNLNNQIKSLQNNLEQFQQERDQHINEHLIQYQDSLREQILITARLTNENNEIHQRLNDEIKIKDLLIDKLQLEIDYKTKQIIEYDENIQTTNNSRIERQLVKNILLSYFHTPIDKQHEVIPLLGALVGFTQEESQKTMNAIANNCNNISGTNWFTSWLGVNSSQTKTQSETSDKSFAELLIQYVDQQSEDNLQQPILELNTDNSSVSTSDNSTQFST